MLLCSNCIYKWLLATYTWFGCVCWISVCTATYVTVCVCANVVIGLWSKWKHYWLSSCSNPWKYRQRKWLMQSLHLAQRRAAVWPSTGQTLVRGNCAMQQWTLHSPSRYLRAHFLIKNVLKWFSWWLYSMWNYQYSYIFGIIIIYKY